MAFSVQKIHFGTRSNSVHSEIHFGTWSNLVHVHFGNPISVLFSQQCNLMIMYINTFKRLFVTIPGLFLPLHFRSRERKDHRENFRSRGTFVPWNIRSLELSLLWNFRSSGAKVPRTFVPWNIRSRGTFVPRERTFQELSFLWNCYIMRTNMSRTFAPNVLKHDL